MKRENEIAEEALKQLALDTGIQGSWHESGRGIVDGDIELDINEKVFHAHAQVKRELRQYQLPQLLEQAQRHKPFMVVAEHIFPAIKEKLRTEKIAYLDTAGNIFIHTADIYIWIEGRKPILQHKAVTNRAFTKAGLKTVFCLLLEPGAINLPYRQLAQTAHVALGNIRNVLDGLKASGFILQRNKQEKILQNKKALLRRWIDGYRETLRPAMHIGNYRFWDKGKINDWQQLRFPEQTNAIWGGESAAAALTGYLNPAELTVYTDDKSPIITAWTLIPDKNGEVRLYEKFWQNADPGNKNGAPPLLVYADLMLTNDPRCLATAEIIYDKYLKHDFEGN